MQVRLQAAVILVLQKVAPHAPSRAELLGFHGAFRTKLACFLLRTFDFQARTCGPVSVVLIAATIDLRCRHGWEVSPPGWPRSRRS